MDNSPKLSANWITPARLICSVMVLLSHLDWIAGNSTDSFRRLGIYAVAIFFGLSGFLLTDSIYRNGATGVFIKNRFLRIFPGYMGVLFLTSFVFAPIYESVKERKFSYLFSTDNVLYILNNFTTYNRQADINGSLEASSVQIWNPPLWTLKFELLCYIILFALLKISGNKFKFIALTITPIFISSYFIARLAGIHIPELLNMILYYSSFFFFGSFLYFVNVHRNSRFRVFLIPFLLTTFVIPRENNTNYFDDRDLFFGLVLIPITLMLCFSLKPKRKIVNDYSFGIYIYAAPVSQLLIHIFPNVGEIWPLYAICTLGVTLVFAWFSWKLIEQPALRLKEKVNTK